MIYTIDLLHHVHLSLMCAATLLWCRRQRVIQNATIESVMVQSWVCVRNICRVMKLQVVLEVDRNEVDLESQRLGGLLTQLLENLKRKNAVALSQCILASNGLNDYDEPSKKRKRVPSDAVVDGKTTKKSKAKHVNIPKVAVCTAWSTWFSATLYCCVSICPQVHGPTHYSRNLRKFGSGLNFDTCHWELFHRDAVVQPFKTVLFCCTCPLLWRSACATPPPSRTRMRDVKKACCTASTTSTTAMCFSRASSLRAR